MVFMVPVREKHQPLLTRIPVQQITAPVSTILVLDKASFCQLRKHQHNLSKLTALMGSIHVTDKYFLAQFTFLTQRRQQQSKQDFAG